MKRLMSNEKYKEQTNIYIDFDNLKNIASEFGVENIKIDIEGNEITFRNKKDNSIWLEIRYENGKWFRY